MNRSSSNKVVVIAVVVALVFALGLLMFLFNIVANFVQAFIPLVVGSLLLIGNRSQLKQLIFSRQASTGMLNVLLGLSLICFGLGEAFFSGNWLRMIFYVPGFALVLAAIPAALNRPSIYTTYRSWGSKVADLGRRAKRQTATVYPTQTPAQPQTTVRLDPTTIDAEPRKY